MNTVLFDLDGTVLPLDIEKFLDIYFKEMGQAFHQMIEPDRLIKNIWTSTEAMVKSTDDRTNESVFMEKFETLIDGDIKEYREKFDLFYDEGFLKTKESTYENEWIKKSVSLLKEKGYTLVLATNPLFPLKAIHHRIKWSGFQPEDFEYITSYENNHYCKPQLKYYEEILKDINKKPEDCMMVGNDAYEDMVASKLGIKTYLIEDNLVNRHEIDIEANYQGNYINFYNFVKKLPEIK